jgi:SynChlorMet cassette radical SAM/SPASM protein ScmF
MIDPALFQSIIKQAKPLGLSRVKLTGGEPLLHPGLNVILKVIVDNDLSLCIETNGTLCTPAISHEIARCKNAFVSVSLDGADAKTHDWVRGVPHSFKKALNGIRNLVNAGIKPQVIMTIMECNKNQLEKVVRLAESIGAGSVKFNIVQPISRGRSIHEKGEALSIKELIQLGQMVENQLSNSSALNLYYNHPLAFVPLRKIFSGNGRECGVCKINSILGVLSDGSYTLCGIGEILPELIFGNAATHSLENIWKNSTVLNELRHGLPKRFEGICGDCLMKNYCLGSCIAQNYSSNKKLWSPYWYCREAEKQGLFPGSRLKREAEII